MNIIDLYVEQGSTFSQTITLNEDITGYSIGCTVVDSSGYKVNNIATITDESVGSITIAIPHTATQYMTVGVALYNVELTDLSGNVTKPFKGRMYIDKEIS